MLTQQVQFWDDDNKEWFGGIMIDNEYIICGCCGSVYECNELEKKKIIPIALKCGVEMDKNL